MGVDPVREGIAYRTDKNLQSLFGQFPRADDGSKAEFPNLIADTIQPVIDLTPLVDPGAVGAIVLETIFTFAVAPAANTPNIVTPPTERWVLWRVAVTHSDAAGHFLTAVIQQPGVGAAFAAVGSDAESVAPNGNWVMNRPLIMQPNAIIAGQTNVAVAAGQISIHVLISRFTLAQEIPQLQIGF